MSHTEIDESALVKSSDLDEASPPDKPVRRNRKFVRGLIGVLLIVMMIEAVSHIRMTIMSQRLWSELQKGERERSDVTRERIDSVVRRPPDATLTVKKRYGEEKYDVYRFWSLLKRRELYVHYGVQGIRSPQEAIGILTTLPDGVANRP